MSDNGKSAIPRHARGKRPHFFEDPSTDQLLGIVLELTQELSVLRERVDSMQVLLDRKGALPTGELESFIPDAETEARRGQLREEYLQRIFRVLRRDPGVFSAGEAEAHARQTEAELTSEAR